MVGGRYGQLLVVCIVCGVADRAFGRHRVDLCYQVHVKGTVPATLSAEISKARPVGQAEQASQTGGGAEG